MTSRTRAVSVAVIGGGAAGYFGAIRAAELGATVKIYEKSSQTLAKVRISGGGRCNVTQACFDPRQMSTAYPRGGRALIGAFHRFQARDTMDWFEARGVALKIEKDGRVFPVSDTSSSIVDALQIAATDAGVELQTHQGMAGLQRTAAGFVLSFEGGGEETVDRVLIAAGACRQKSLVSLMEGLGHTVLPPVPSLFTFETAENWPRELAGLSVPNANLEVNLTPKPLRNSGPVLFTHQGLSGPGILKLSAFGARTFAQNDYQFALKIDWSAGAGTTFFEEAFADLRTQSPGKTVKNTPVTVPARLWQSLVAQSDIEEETRWAILKKVQARELARRLTATELQVVGKSLNKEEFVTCGGVALPEVDFRTMQSRVVPGLHFAGEVLDLDGITGGYNFQAAWTTGWIAGTAMAEGVVSS